MVSEIQSGKDLDLRGAQGDADIRWFWSSKGNPVSSGYPTWFVMPDGLGRSTLDGLPISYKLRYLLDEYLRGDMDGKTLTSKHAQHPAGD